MTDPHPIVKCLIWDLDNTLWTGTLLEDGEVTVPDTIRAAIVELDRRGVLQSIASRNDHDHAWSRLEALGLAEYFVLPHIGWGPKSDSVRAITDRLGFAADTIAFVDDQPTERAEVAYHLPATRCYPAELAATLPTRPEFGPAVVTADSRRRRAMYQAGFARDAARATHRGPDEAFLRSLDLVMEITHATPDAIARVAELTLRTSQMNATGVHYDEARLRALTGDADHDVLVVTLSDRFGDHGAVGVLLVHTLPGVWHLRLLATSCRVVSFGAGTVLLRWLIDAAATADVHLVADFRRTGRNRMMEVAYGFAGFRADRCACLDALPPPREAPAAHPTASEPVARLHLVPVRQEPPTTMRVLGPRLSGQDRPRGRERSPRPDRPPATSRRSSIRGC